MNYIFPLKHTHTKNCVAKDISDVKYKLKFADIVHNMRMLYNNNRCAYKC